MRRLREWLRRKLRRKRKTSTTPTWPEDPPPDPELPLLPTNRRNISTVSLLDKENSPSFFSLLPAEIRRQIYMEAFGARTYHMDLDYDFGDPHDRDSTVWQWPTGWKWWSCVCKRHLLLNPPWDSCLFPPTSRDVCGNVNGTYARKKPEEYCLGVMGWLLTCRQAYIEGIDVLFRTNTIHIRNHVLLQNLPKMVLPQRLASITALELSYEFCADPHTDPHTVHNSEHQKREWDQYDRFMSTVAPAFKSLQKVYLYVAFMSNMRAEWTYNVDKDMRYFLGPVDEMVRKLAPKLKVCQLALPERCFDAYQAGTSATMIERGGTGKGSWEMFWRTVPMQQDAEVSLGYWVAWSRDREGVLSSHVSKIQRFPTSVD